MPTTDGPNHLEHLLRENAALLKNLLRYLEGTTQPQAIEQRPGTTIPLIGLTDDWEPLDPVIQQRAAELTAHQLNYIRLACHPSELPNVRIADRMGISRHAVDKLAQKIYRKFNVSTRQGLLMAVLRYGVGSG